ncbi:AAA family ATPase, partial [Rhizobium ruizarguesonis]
MEAWRAGNIPWKDVDRGLLLSGPPGCGNTINADALARTCGVHLVETSVARRQSAGYLSETLKAMRKSFADAIAKKPSILFLDEFDAIGD